MTENPNETANIREQRRLLAEQIARLDAARLRMAKHHIGQSISRVYRVTETCREALCIEHIYPTEDGIIIVVR